MIWFNCYSFNNQLAKSLLIKVCSRVVGNGFGKWDTTSEQLGLEKVLEGRRSSDKWTDRPADSAKGPKAWRWGRARGKGPHQLLDTFLGVNPFCPATRRQMKPVVSKKWTAGLGLLCPPPLTGLVARVFQSNHISSREIWPQFAISAAQKWRPFQNISENETTARRSVPREEPSPKLETSC